MKKISEKEVFNFVRQYLIESCADVLQLVPPGGQAPISVSFVKDDQRKTCYPDLIALLKNEILIGEFKPGYSKADHAKIDQIITFGASETRSLISRHRSTVDCSSFEIVGLLCHSDVKAPAIDGIRQWIFNAEQRIFFV